MRWVNALVMSWSMPAVESESCRRVTPPRHAATSPRRITPPGHVSASRRRRHVFLESMPSVSGSSLASPDTEIMLHRCSPSRGGGREVTVLRPQKTRTVATNLFGKSISVCFRNCTSIRISGRPNRIGLGWPSWIQSQKH